MTNITRKLATIAGVLFVAWRSAVRRREAGRHGEYVDDTVITQGQDCDLQRAHA